MINKELAKSTIFPIMERRRGDLSHLSKIESWSKENKEKNPPAPQINEELNPQHAIFPIIKMVEECML